ncbi:hypothetical protein VCRA2114E365_40217 [Vibrio crassostreae]|nr:hypothetical protein VCRA2113O351_30084 [Vibrio crassostreae]CAK2106165.1 hypothetical protein VCRA2113O358_40083 [Vibrio crassostreae]CAK2114278.1 hypothetical protein VCRA2113O359_40083 [Vibrio crassostreae]CAK2114842.1 hypothetical protein VCRA2113O354_40083 [Vibrio crassostreae]CAK2121903.1 hypothetical protein VCRA2113O357_40217 [Vibrio crassostreae]
MKRQIPDKQALKTAYVRLKVMQRQAFSLLADSFLLSILLGTTYSVAGLDYSRCLKSRDFY